jgi:hypothetical protein
MEVPTISAAEAPKICPAALFQSLIFRSVSVLIKATLACSQTRR